MQAALEEQAVRILFAQRELEKLAQAAAKREIGAARVRRHWGKND
jgi:hypothetical protein